MWKSIILDVECIVCNKSLQKINHDPIGINKKMGKIINRRSRTPNWSLEEKQYLLELIKQRKEVVVKNNNGPNHSEEKDIAWNEILRALAIKHGTKFSLSSIKKVKTQWQNMKRIAREEIALVGPAVEKYSKQSLEVCNILDLVQDGVLKRDENVNETTLTTNVVVKTECIDEDLEQPGCSSQESYVIINQQNHENEMIDNHHQSSSSSVSEQISEINDCSNQEELISEKTKRNASCMTESHDEESINPFHNELKEFFRYTKTEKQLKMESLKEERNVIKAMRETAELNKIIAEQRLKHVLWLKKQEMA